jgi:hypothetical protein
VEAVSYVNLVSYRNRKYLMFESLIKSPRCTICWSSAALDRLVTAGIREGRIVELRFFGGLTEDEIAEVLGVSAIHGEARIADREGRTVSRTGRGRAGGGGRDVRPERWQRTKREDWAADERRWTRIRQRKKRIGPQMNTDKTTLSAYEWSLVAHRVISEAGYLEPTCERNSSVDDIICRYLGRRRSAGEEGARRIQRQKHARCL